MLDGGLGPAGLRARRAHTEGRAIRSPGPVIVSAGSLRRLVVVESPALYLLSVLRVEGLLLQVFHLLVGFGRVVSVPGLAVIGHRSSRIEIGARVGSRPAPGPAAVRQVRGAEAPRLTARSLLLRVG